MSTSATPLVPTDRAGGGLSFQTLQGFPDLLPAAAARACWFATTVAQGVDAWGYAPYRVPAVERAELYLAKSGPELVAQCYAVGVGAEAVGVLRPEVTPSLVRLLAPRLESLRRPSRLYTLATCWRSERPQRGRLREFTQLNVDLLGEPGVAADVEILLVAQDTLARLGLAASQTVLRLADRRLVPLLLATARRLAGQDPEGWALELGAVVGRVLPVLDRRGRARAEDTRADLAAALAGATGGAEGERAELVRDLVLALLDRPWSALGPELARTLDLFDAEAGTSDTADRRSDAPARAELREAARAGLERLDAVMAGLDRAGGARDVVVDLGIVRGLGYYTGLVFEAFAGTERRAVLGGGRYDRLFAELGGRNLPAVGFGLGDVVVLDALEALGLLPPVPPEAEVMVLDPDVIAGLGLARELRAQGLRVTTPLRAVSAGRARAAAQRAGVRFVVEPQATTPDGTCYEVRDLQTGDRSAYGTRDALVAALRAPEAPGGPAVTGRP